MLTEVLRKKLEKDLNYEHQKLKGSNQEWWQLVYISLNRPLLEDPYLFQ